MSRIRIYNEIYQSDIFNRKSKIQFYTPKKRNLQPSLEKTLNDIFHTNDKLTFKQDMSQYKHSNKYINKSQSDVFNVKPENKKIRIRNNPTNHSQIIFGTNYTDYIVKKPKIEKFTPQYSENSPLDIFYKQYFNEENHHKNFSTSKGYLDNEIKINNSHILENPIRKKTNWTNRSSADIHMNPLNSSRINKLNSQISNIFNLPEKYINNIEIKKKNENNLNEKYLKSKVKGLERIKNNKNKDMKGEDNIKGNSNQRKQNKIIRSNKLNDNIIYKKKKEIKSNLNDNISQYKKIKRLIDLNSPLLNEPKKKKILQNVSTSNLYDNDYYERILSTDRNFNNKINENEYIIKNNNKERDDEKTLQKMFSGEGIHIYDINSNYDKIFGDSNECEFTFKVRNNDENKFKSVSQKFLKEKNIEIKPKNKIKVNRKFIQANSERDNNNNLKTTCNNSSNSKFMKDKFTNQFTQINNNYKNNRKHIGNSSFK